MIQRMTLPEYRRHGFKGKAPSAKSLKEDVKEGRLAGEIVNKGIYDKVYIFVDKETGNPTWPVQAATTAIQPINDVAAKALAQISSAA